jgi:hypothetical protein
VEEMPMAIATTELRIAKKTFILLSPVNCFQVLACWNTTLHRARWLDDVFSATRAPAL